MFLNSINFPPCSVVDEFGLWSHLGGICISFSCLKANYCLLIRPNFLFHPSSKAMEPLALVSSSCVPLAPVKFFPRFLFRVMRSSLISLSECASMPTVNKGHRGNGRVFVFQSFCGIRHVTVWSQNFHHVSKVFILGFMEHESETLWLASCWDHSTNLLPVAIQTHG